MAIAIALPGFTSLELWVTSIFFFLDSYFLYQFEQMKKRYRWDFWICFCKMHHRIPLFLSMRLFQMLFEGLSFVKTLVTLVITYATDLPLQNMTKIVCLLSLCFDIFNNKTLWTTLNYVTQFFSPYQGSFPHAETKKVTLNFFFFISDTSCNLLPDWSENSKKSISEKFS